MRLLIYVLNVQRHRATIFIYNMHERNELVERVYAFTDESATLNSKKTICSVENPIPGIEVQKAITKMHTVCSNRKKINE